ncbi:hypothetical protein Z045_26010 [Rhodococcus pyridinivorans KG-16]|uniref:FRG domain-containing protein n=2 Tax=Rhodococcus pyridinivorans TaxID=103816 RepID=A0A0V9UD61_9NOCA|nr:hypothetical protein Z045_26010 [Rhodococcus pyridinivorans KG-16]
MMKQFRQDAAPRLRERPRSNWEWIFLAQHYGMPTRLLDWSENPLIGLYFAVEDDGKADPVDGAFFELEPARLNRAAFADAPRVVMFDDDEFLNGYLPTAPKGPRQGPIAAIASRSFERIIAQVGTFTVNHHDHTPLEDTPGKDSVRRVLVPAPAKPRIRAELADMNVNASTVYPDLAHLADHLKGIYRR